MAGSSATLPASMQGTDVDDLADQLFVKGIGQEVLDSWVAKEAACAPSRGQASVLDGGMRRMALKHLVALTDRFAMLALSRSANCLDEVGMKRMDATSLAVAIFYRLDDRVLLGTAATFSQTQQSCSSCSNSNCNAAAAPWHGWQSRSVQAMPSRP